MNLTSNSDGLSVENNLTTTTLAINDLKFSDSGEYALHAYFQNHEPKTEYLRLVVKGSHLNK